MRQLIGCIALIGLLVLLFFQRNACEKEFSKTKSLMAQVIEPGILTTFEEAVSRMLTAERAFSFGVGVTLSVVVCWLIQ